MMPGGKRSQDWHQQNVSNGNGVVAIHGAILFLNESKVFGDMMGAVLPCTLNLRN